MSTDIENRRVVGNIVRVDGAGVVVLDYSGEPKFRECCNLIR